ncbi:MAG: 4-hydroxythreonine-4-phosphate dehydrogenase PdxA [Nitrospirales bacterium]|nr:4-hydroxythreonine-4-phosphate dehydrogenase PdxA [Nitrospirales bacterium]
MTKIPLPGQQAKGRPLLAMTMGDPAGIGPEIIVKALASEAIWCVCRPVVIGSLSVFQNMVQGLGSSLRVMAVPWDTPVPEWSVMKKGTLPVIDPLSPRLKTVRLGRAAASSGAASVACIHTAVQLALAGHVSGMVTAPINKEAMHMAGYDFRGHTELLADLTHSKRVAMMLLGGPLKIVFATTHLSIRDLPQALTVSRISQAIRLAHHGLQEYFQIVAPRIAVAALNPHAGERGLFGQEERLVIAPAVKRAKRLGIQTVGPLPADTLFGEAARGSYDAVVAMYHDQGLIPLKLMAFGKCVNVTIGLPIVRTSVDHGTAYDIVGTGQASPQSLIEAIHLAARLVQRRQSLS